MFPQLTLAPHTPLLPAELHVLDGAPQTIFVKANYSVEVRCRHTSSDTFAWHSRALCCLHVAVHDLSGQQAKQQAATWCVVIA